jgi:Peptidase inhibitor family I36
VSKAVKLFAIAALATTSVVLTTGPASADRPACAGHSTGLCVWENTNFAGPNGWWERHVFQNDLSNNFYHDTGTAMFDTISSIRNIDNQCTAFVFNQTNFGGNNLPPTDKSVTFPPNTQFQSMAQSAIGNNSVRSLIIQCPGDEA